MRPTIVVRKNDTSYEIISKAKNALKVMEKNVMAGHVAVEAMKIKSIEKLKQYLSNYVNIRTEESI